MLPNGNRGPMQQRRGRSRPYNWQPKQTNQRAVYPTAGMPKLDSIPQPMPEYRHDTQYRINQSMTKVTR